MTACGNSGCIQCSECRSRNQEDCNSSKHVEYLRLKLIHTTEPPSYGLGMNGFLFYATWYRQLCTFGLYGYCRYWNLTSNHSRCVRHIETLYHFRAHEWYTWYEKLNMVGTLLFSKTITGPRNTSFFLICVPKILNTYAVTAIAPYIWRTNSRRDYLNS